MLLNRIAAGMLDHFRLRATSWIMSYALFWFGVSMTWNVNALHVAGREYLFDYLLMVAPARIEGPICIAFGVARLAALVVNGTFPSFVWSAPIRAVGSIFGAFFWFQIVLGVVHGSWLNLAFSVYTTFLLLEMFNVYIAMLEIEPPARTRLMRVRVHA